MVVHLLTNATVLNGAGSFQDKVITIHSLGAVLPLIEWVFIFLPILFHAIFGFVIIAGGLPNTNSYPYVSNIRYTLQRATGIIAFLFIMWHVFHLHGWIHADWWITRIYDLNGAQFKPYNAATSASLALQPIIFAILYAVGVLACVFHLANGVWTMGITWGVWVSPRAQRVASHVCTVFGVGLAVVGLSALVGMRNIASTEDSLREAREAENTAVQTAIDLGKITDDPHKQLSEEELESHLKSNDSDQSSETSAAPQH